LSPPDYPARGTAYDDHAVGECAGTGILPITASGTAYDDPRHQCGSLGSGVIVTVS